MALQGGISPVAFSLIPMKIMVNTPQVGKHRQISLLNNLLKLPERQQHEPPLCDWCLSELEGGTRLFEGPCKRKISKCTTTEKERPPKDHKVTN